MKDFISTCLTISARDRPTPRQLLDHVLFEELKDADPTSESAEGMQFEVFPGFHSRRLPVCRSIKHPLLERSLQELYYLWHLAGGDVQAELKKQGLIRTKAPILSIPKYVLSKQNAKIRIKIVHKRIKST